MAVSVIPETDFCASSAAEGQFATRNASVDLYALNRLSSSSSCTSSSSSAAMRFFSVSYICVGSTGWSGAFFLPFCGGGCVPFAGAPLGGRVPGWVCAVFGGTGGAAAGAGGVGPAGAGLPCLAVCVPFMVVAAAAAGTAGGETGILVGRQQVKRARRRILPEGSARTES